MIPELLEAVIEKYDSDEIRIYIDRTDFTQIDGIVEFTLIVDEFEEQVKQEWKVRIKNPIVSVVSNEIQNRLQIFDHHPLLLEYKDQECSLYFSGKCSNPELLFVDLYQSHFDQCANYIHFSKYINNPTDFMSVLKVGYGLLAEGPKSLMQLYATQLQKHNVSYNLIGSRQPKYWDGNEYQKISPEVRLLFLGKAYFIGDQFDFEERTNLG